MKPFNPKTNNNQSVRLYFKLSLKSYKDIVKLKFQSK